MISFIHTADVHLDAPLTQWASLYEQRQFDFRQTMQTIRDLVVEKQVDFWFIAGDLLEYHGGRRSTALFLCELFASIDPVPVFIAPGNHDPWQTGSLYQTLEWPANVIFFTPEWGVFEFPEKSCVVYGWGFPQAHVHDSPLQHFPGKLPGYQVHFMVLHGTVLTAETSEHQPYAPLAFADLSGAGMDYIALGHIHKPAEFTGPQGTVFAAYPGSPEGLSRKEANARHVLYGRVKEDGRLTLQRLPVATRVIHKLEVEINGVETAEKLLQLVSRRLNDADPKDIYYVTLSGERASHFQPPLELLQQHFSHLFYIQFADQSWPDVDADKLIAESGVFGRWLQKLQEAEANAKDEANRTVVSEARAEALRRIGGSLQ